MSEGDKRTLKVAVLGCGAVGSQVVRLLSEQHDDLAARVGAPVELVGVAVRRLDAARDVEVPDGLLRSEFPLEVLLGSLHAAEHTQIAVLPLIAMCDRWDIGGLSTNSHPQTARPTVFIYDGHAGGVGITRIGFRMFETLVDDARRLIAECPCKLGCPSCVQSPKCGNLNEPLNKNGALEVLTRMQAA